MAVKSIEKSLHISVFGGLNLEIPATVLRREMRIWAHQWLNKCKQGLPTDSLFLLLILLKATFFYIWSNESTIFSNFYCKFLKFSATEFQPITKSLWNFNYFVIGWKRFSFVLFYSCWLMFLMTLQLFLWHWIYPSSSIMTIDSLARCFWDPHGGIRTDRGIFK